MKGHFGRMHSSRQDARHGISRAGYVGIVVVLVAIVAFAGYATLGGGPTTQTTTLVKTQTSVQTTTLVTTASPTVKTIQVALIMEGPELDQSFNQIFSENLHAIVAGSKGTVNATYIDNVGPSDVQRVSSTFAQQGFDLIIGDANDLGPGMSTVASQFPKSNFAVYGGNVLGPNLGSFVLWANEGGYVAGYLAGLMTKTGKVGTIVAFKFQSQIAWTNGYMQGVRRAATELKRNITVINGWTSTWTDPALGLQSANSMLASGVDVISEDASGPGAGMQQAVKAAFKDPSTGPWAMGAFVNQNSLGPFMIGSVPWNVRPALQLTIQQVRDGTFGGKIIQFFLHDGAMTLVMSSTVPSEIQTKVNDLIGSITKGQVVVPLVQTPDLIPTGTITVP